MILVLLPFSDDVPPLTPSGDEARRWAEQELSNPVYAAARPTVFDQVAAAIRDFFANLFRVSPGGVWGWWIAAFVAIVVVLLIIGAFLIWGRSRTVAQTRRASDLFGDVEERTAAQLRRAADAAAARAAWDEAVVLRFRALARGLDERDVVHTAPGATAHGFARAAGRRIPSAAVALETAATAFDDVRYLRRPGTPDLYARVVAAETAAAGASPSPALADAGAPA